METNSSRLMPSGPPLPDSSTAFSTFARHLAHQWGWAVLQGEGPAGIHAEDDIFTLKEVWEEKA